MNIEKTKEIRKERKEILNQIFYWNKRLVEVNIKLWNEEHQPFKVGEDVMCLLKFGKSLKYKKCKIVEEEGKIYIRLYDIESGSLLNYKKVITNELFATFKKVE